MSLLEIQKLPTAENSAIHLHPSDNVAIKRQNLMNLQVYRRFYTACGIGLLSCAALAKGRKGNNSPSARVDLVIKIMRQRRQPIPPSGPPKVPLVRRHTNLQLSDFVHSYRSSSASGRFKPAGIAFFVPLQGAQASIPNNGTKPALSSSNGIEDAFGHGSASHHK